MQIIKGICYVSETMHKDGLVVSTSEAARSAYRSSMGNRYCCSDGQRKDRQGQGQGRQGCKRQRQGQDGQGCNDGQGQQGHRGKGTGSSSTAAPSPPTVSEEEAALATQTQSLSEAVTVKQRFISALKGDNSACANSQRDQLTAELDELHVQRISIKQTAERATTLTSRLKILEDKMSNISK